MNKIDNIVKSPASNAKESWVKKVENYATTVNMDAKNKEALMVIGTQGEQAFINHMFTEKKANGEKRQLSFSEMREMYG